MGKQSIALQPEYGAETQPRQNHSYKQQSTAHVTAIVSSSPLAFEPNIYIYDDDDDDDHDDGDETVEPKRILSKFQAINLSGVK